MAYARNRAGRFEGYYRDVHGKRMPAEVCSTKEEVLMRGAAKDGI